MGWGLENWAARSQRSAQEEEVAFSAPTWRAQSSETSRVSQSRQNPHNRTTAGGLIPLNSEPRGGPSPTLSPLLLLL